MEATIDLPDELANQIKKLMLASAIEAFQLVSKRASLPYWMNKGEAADYMNVSRHTLDGYIRDGLKVAIKDGTQRISQKSADEYYEKYEI